MITATDQNPFEASADMFSKARGTYETLGTGAGSLTNINDYLNPYYNQVLDAALGRMNTSYQLNNNALGDAALSAGAFGGDRHGVMEGVLAGEHLKNVGELSANVNMANFNSAADRSFRDMVTSAQGLTQLGNTNFGIGQTIMQNQAQQGQQQQDLLNLILGQGQGQFDAYMSQPYRLIDMMSALLGSDARRGQGTTTQNTTPGLFDWLSLGLQTAGGVS